MASVEDNWEIFVADADGSNPTNVSNSPGMDAFPSWSPHSERLTWVTERFGGKGAEIIVADIDGNKVANVSNQVNTDDLLPVWSPNGQFIAYLSTRFRDGEVFIGLPDGTAFNLSDSEADDIFLDWSPVCAELSAGDSWAECLLLIGSNRSHERGSFSDEFTLYTISADGVIFNFALDVDLKVSEAVFAPDGKQIAYLKRDLSTETIDIYLLDLATKEETRLTEDEIIKSSTAWSPTGDTIAYVSMIDDEPDEIYAVSVPDGKTTNLTANRAPDALNRDIAWSPSGDKILFSTLRDGNPEIYVMDADGSNPTNLTNTPRGVEIEPFWIQ